MSNKDKSLIIFKWILKKNNCKISNLPTDLIKKEDLNITESIPCWIYNKEVKISVLKPFMTLDAYRFLCKTVQDKKKKNVWVCFVCKGDLSDDNSIGCDQCLVWMHFHCIELKKVPEVDVPFYCKNCLKQ